MLAPLEVAIYVVLSEPVKFGSHSRNSEFMTSLKKGPTRPEIASTQGRGEWAAWRGPTAVTEGKRLIYDLRMVYRSVQAGQI